MKSFEILPKQNDRVGVDRDVRQFNLELLPRNLHGYERYLKEETIIKTLQFNA